MIINHNLPALNTYNKLVVNNNSTAKAMEKLSSGLRINRAGDDAAGLAISEKMRSQIRGLDQASRNSQDGISLIQTAEGALSETQNILQRMRELTVQAGNDTYTTTDRNKIGLEVQQLQKEINRISSATEFNTKKLLNSKISKVGFQVGANSGQTITMSVLVNAKASLLVGANYGSKFSSIKSSTVGSIIAAINKGIGSVSKIRANLGAYQNRLEHTIANLDTSSENLSAAESRIRDVDMAKEMMNYTKSNILSQAAQAMLAQANQQPQGVLQLLR
ncbi:MULTISPECIES: flagellin [Paenibacillus]|uniref:Flagellin n=2 Tax=Paenibacillus TaxID=44249 RepID=A0ABU3RNC8_9BACL|nr:MULTISPECIES: flagellin [Paenibacillus]MDU0205694.1 flagellin [Paenibacillus sp. PFR10]MEB4795116.1 flagellin [Paenibacillus chondroitinus]MEC0267593.1 flagellin [Paenibacillus anseongense]